MQNNISYNATKGVTRGIHAEPWDKYISIAAGEIFGGVLTCARRELRPGVHDLSGPEPRNLRCAAWATASRLCRTARCTRIW